MSESKHIDSTRHGPDQKGEPGEKTLILESEIERLKSEIECKNREIDHVTHPVVLPDGIYSLESACRILRIGKTRMLEIRKKYEGDGITRLGQTFSCYGRDLMRIIVKESGAHE